ncbi:MAG: 4Fe-4S binding protein [Clostridium argentinense]|uniref:4Fe-4S binding protein n=1 Tax=Clostridium faecium TaxID=2762223 RepID=A0ABR8YSQ1_9CLOT|nr:MULTISPECIES: 4Fe-4S binding protein [Clostridium]MBD8047271.1 4Fe-4S binding protein [Clostridium faecium]MBS5822535.1 4Fe-4S binding protein [Clostridium argentinense]MDU1347974.1 4Fe-4S binding protein [Clostridium argentinense]
MIRRIVHINEEKCNGCGICVNACHERAIEIVNGKAKLVSDIYCDGLGDCLNCPEGAIEIIEREAEAYNDEAVKRRIEDMDKNQKESKEEKPMPCGCPGTMAKKIERKSAVSLNTAALKNDKYNSNKEEESIINSELTQWPVQLRLVNPNAAYFEGANLLIAADCTAYAYANFHRDFIKNHITVIGCPKLDDNDYYREKLAEILKSNNIKSITVIRMEVPCCSGIVNSVKSAMLQSQTIVPYREVTVGINGELI